MSTTRPPFWPKGLPLTIRTPRVPLTHYVQTAAQRYPGKPAIIYCGQQLTYAQLLAQVEAMAGFLQQRLGVKRGDRVLLFSQNCPQFVVAFYAALRAQAVVVPVNAMSITHELEHFVGDSGAKVAFVAQEMLPQLAPCIGGTGLQAAVVHAYSDAIAPGLPHDVVPEVMRAPRQPLPGVDLHAFQEAVALCLVPGPDNGSADDLALLPYTSGTTGRPKGCMHSHATFMAAGMGSQLWRGLHPESVFLAAAPLFHMLGLQNTMNMPVSLGATMVMLPRWNPVEVARLIELHQVSVWTAPPAMLIDFFARPEATRHDLSSLTVLYGGGAAMPEAVAGMLHERFGITYNEGYGMTETASVLHANPLAHSRRQCLGIPIFGVETRIVDPESLVELPMGEVGELVTSGPQVHLGYWRNETANQSAFFERDGKRFFRTGDLATKDCDGFYYMRDRLKRMINVSGFKVWPAEVENLLYAHPGILEACVVGVADPRAGEAVRALIVRRPQQPYLTEQELIDWCRQHMAVYKAPRSVKFMAELPKSDTGKILWRELQVQENAL